MRDKQIIIDGVDVSGCKGFYIHDRSTTNIDYWMYGQCKSSKEYGCYCRNNPNCYYKQLARKTQECEELKAYAQRQENQREVYYKEYLKLSQECEELKKEIAFGNNGTLLDKIRAMVFTDLNKENNKLSKTLTEIKGIAENRTNYPCVKCIKTEILQKISECEVNND